MPGQTARTAYLVFSIPFCLLLMAALLRLDLQRQWTWWQPPVGQAQELVGRTLLGGNLHEPVRMVQWSIFWGTVAGVTLVICGVLFGAARSWYAVPWLYGSRWQPVVCRFSALAPWIALVFFPLFTIELIAIFYLLDVLINGAVMMMAPACALLIAVTAIAFPFAFWRTGEVDDPPLRVNGKLLDPSTQSAFFKLLFETAPEVNRHLMVAATVGPPLDLLHGRTQFDQQVVKGNVLLIPLSLLRSATVAEFRCLVAQACLPLRWAPGAWAMIEVAGAGRSLARRMTAAMRDSVFVRLVPGILPALGLALDVAEWQPDTSAWTVPPSLETDRAIAARFGADDLARAILKIAIQQALWPKFLYAVVERWRSGVAADAVSVRRLALEFQQFLQPERIQEAQTKLALDAGESLAPSRLANLGFPTRDTWPVLDFCPPEAAIDLMEDRDAIEDELTTAERARFVFIPSLS